MPNTSVALWVETFQRKKLPHSGLGDSGGSCRDLDREPSMLHR